MDLDIDSLIERVQSTHSKYIEEKQKFKAELESSKDEYNKVSQELTGANNKIAELTAELTSAKTELNNTKIQLSDATTKEKVDQIMNNDAAVYKELQNKYDALKAKYDLDTSNLAKTIEDLNKNTENFETYSNSLKNEIKDTNTALASLQNKYTDLENQKNDLDIAYKELKDKHNKSIEDTATSDAEVEDLRKIIQSQKDELAASKDKYDNLKSKTLGTIKHLVEEVIEPREITYNNLIESMKNMVNNSDYQNVINSNNELIAKVESLTKDISNRDSRIVELTQKISSLTEELENLKSKQNTTHTHLQDYIDSTIPVPKDSAAADIKPLRQTKDTIITALGNIPKDKTSSILAMIDNLYSGAFMNSNSVFPLNNALQAAESAGLSVSMGNTVMDRLCAMSKNGKPIVYFNGNIYYATIDKEALKDYIIRG